MYLTEGVIAEPKILYYVVRRMDDEPQPLSLEEKNSLYMKAVISFAPILVAFVAYFVYRMNTSPFKSMFEGLLEWALPFMVTCMLAMMLTVEIFYHVKVKKPFKFHAKRFGMNALLICMLTASFLAVFVSVNAALSSYVGERGSMLIALLSWSMLIAVITFKFQRVIRKYWKEP